MQKGSALIPLTLFVAVIVLAVGSGWYYLNNRDEEPPTSFDQPVIISPPPAAMQPESFSDDTSGLRFEIPSGYKVINESEDQYFERENGDIRKNFTYYVQYPPAKFVKSFYLVKKGMADPEKSALGAVIFENPENLSPAAFYNKYWYYPFVWGEFSTGEKNKLSPSSVELVGGKGAGTAIVSYRDSNPKFFYIPIKEKNLMLQLRMPMLNNKVGEDVVSSLSFE